MNLEISLNPKDLSHAIRTLKRYKSSLEEKNEIFVRKLLDEGIHVAYQYAGGFRNHIEFYKEGKGGIRSVSFLIAKDKPITVEWDYFGEKKTAQVNMLLMAEFGSGRLAEVLFDISGVGQGTFPGQTHASDPKGWKYKEWDSNHKGKWHWSEGVRPTHPMYHADMEMIKTVDRIAREVFGDV